MQIHLSRALLALCMALAALLMGSRPAQAASNEELDRDSRAALASLYAGSPTAKALGDRAKAILVFPDVLKAGLIVGGQGGDGVYMKKGKTVGYYNTAAASIGLQAGAQTFGYALFFMKDEVVKSFESSSGFEVGVGPTVVVVDAGMAKDLNTLTGKDDVYAFIFSQKGLMAGVGIQGSKITKLKR